MKKGVDTKQQLSNQRLSKQRHHKTADCYKTAITTKQQHLQNNDSYNTATVL